jgi:ferritin
MAKVVLFHGTSKNRLAQIQRDGLDPHAKKSSSGADYVYLTDSPEIAAEFSGYGADKQGVMHEGYMAPRSGKIKNGVVLKVEVDSKWLKPDQIWKEKLGQLKKRDATIKSLAAEILADVDGDQILRFYVEEESYKLAKQEIKDDPETFSEEDLDALAEDLWEHAAENVSHREATKIVDGQLEELKKFSGGKLYQCANMIPPSNIKGVLPASKFLSGDRDNNFGSELIKDVYSCKASRA